MCHFVCVRVGTSKKHYPNINKQNFKENHQFKTFCIRLSLYLHHEGCGKGWVFPFERMFVRQLKLAGNSFQNFRRKFQEIFGKLAHSGQPWRPWHFLWILFKLFPASLSWPTNILSQRENSSFFQVLIANLKGHSEVKFLICFIIIYVKGTFSYLFQPLH